jgi:kynurenine formamidase
LKADHFLGHIELHRMSRREALRMAAAAGAAGALAGAGIHAEEAGADEADADGMPSAGSSQRRFTDEMFDVDRVLAGAWDDTAFYRKGDERGTFREVTPRKTQEALRILQRGAPVVTYNLGTLMFNGIPAYGTTPARIYDQRLTVLGYEPPSGFGGIAQTAAPLGPNRVSIHEERFTAPSGSRYTHTYQIGTQLDNLNHIGVGPVFYGGHRGPDIAAAWGTKQLGAENVGPLVTRGLLLDVLGVKRAQGASDAIETASNGRPHLAATYRITLEDLEAAMRMAKIRRIRRGDVVLLRTGWNQLVNPQSPSGGHAPDNPDHPGHPDHAKYLATAPGIYLRETRWLASHRPAIIGSDTWALEVLGNRVTETNVFPCHQELLVHHGIRIGEGIVTDDLARDRVYEFVYVVTPQYARGATAGNTPPAALGQPRRRARRRRRA